MNTALRTGPAFSLREQRLIYDPIRGGQIVSIYDCSIDGVSAVVNSLFPWERFETASNDPPYYQVTVYSPDPNEAPIWELVTNFKEIDIYEWGRLKGISESNLKLMKAYFAGTQSGSVPTFTGPDATLAGELFTLVQYNHLKRFTEDTVLRYTVTITNAVQTVLAYANVDRLFSTVQLLTPATSGLIIPNPTYNSILLQKDPPTEIATIAPNTSGSAFMWSWLKRRPTSRQTQIGKSVIVGEYWLQAWSTFEYTPM